jgi:hypothetical protein
MQIVLGGLLGALSGPFSTALAEQFPTRMRASGLGIVANLATTVFAGFAPLYVRPNEMPWSPASTRVDSTSKLGLGMDRSAVSR